MDTWKPIKVSFMDKRRANRELDRMRLQAMARLKIYYPEEFESRTERTGKIPILGLYFIGTLFACGAVELLFPEDWQLGMLGRLSLIILITPFFSCAFHFWSLWERERYLKKIDAAVESTLKQENPHEQA